MLHVALTTNCRNIAHVPRTRLQQSMNHHRLSAQFLDELHESGDKPYVPSSLVTRIRKFNDDSCSSCPRHIPEVRLVLHDGLVGDHPDVNVQLLGNVSAHRVVLADDNNAMGCCCTLLLPLLLLNYWIDDARH